MTNFLADLFETGSEYCTLNSYRSAISAFHNGELVGVPTGRHPLVTYLMKGIGNSHSLTPWYNLIWDIEKSLNVLVVSLQTTKFSLKLFSLKLAMFLVWETMNRGSEIKSVSPVIKENTVHVVAACQNLLLLWHVILNCTP